MNFTGQKCPVIFCLCDKFVKNVRYGWTFVAQGGIIQ